MAVLKLRTQRVSASTRGTTLLVRPHVTPKRCQRLGCVRAVVETAASSTEVQSSSGLDSLQKTEDIARPQGSFASMNSTKIICTIGPATNSPEMLQQLAANGMDVARLNMTHESHAWHADVIHNIQRLNEQGYNIAIMMDTEGSEAHLRPQEPVKVQAGQEVVFTVRAPPEDAASLYLQVSYEAFVDDVKVGDMVMVDGGMVIVEVTDIAGPDVTGTVIEPGKVLSRANLTLRRDKKLVRGRSSMLPVITAKDWQDIDFAVEQRVDFLAVSFVRSPDVIDNVRSYVNSQLKRRHPSHRMDIVAKLEAYDSVAAMPEIITASDGIMVARSDLGAQIPMEDVPAVQKEIVFRCRQMGKPVFVASQLLNSMIDVPVPTRAEVADCADAVRQQADALMLSGETAAGQYPIKCIQVLNKVYEEVDGWTKHEKPGMMQYPDLAATMPGRISEEICNTASTLAGNLDVKAIIVVTRTGRSASFLSRRRPDCPILAVTDSESVMRRLAARWGVKAFRMPLDDHPETNIEQTFQRMRETKHLQNGDLVVVVSDVLTSNDVVRSVQLRHVT